MTAPASILGASRVRDESRDKVTGGARYAFEFNTEGQRYGWVVGATIAKGMVTAIDASRALALDGVEHVMTHEDAPRLEPEVNAELEILQRPEVAFHGQVIALVIADCLEAAREGAALVDVTYVEAPHDVILRTDDRSKLFDPGTIPSEDSDTEQGDPEGAFADAPVTVDVTYRTPPEHNNPMEPHATVARWDGDRLIVHDSTQGASTTRDVVAKLFGLEPEAMDLFNQHVGGGFGSKGSARPNVVLAAQAAKLVGGPVKLAMTRQQMWPLTGHRSPTQQRLRLGASESGEIQAVLHDTVSHVSSPEGFQEGCGTGTRVMYAGANRRTTHRALELDIPHTSWMRGPGHTPGLYALESAIDELAYAAGLDPIALRERNEPPEDPELGIPFSSRGLLECLRTGAERFGWSSRDPRPAIRLEGRKLIGTGVAGSTYPAQRMPSSASAVAHPNGTFTVSIAATDIGTGARTVLAQIAADGLAVDRDLITLRIGDSRLPQASVAGGSAGTASWGSAIVMACDDLRSQLEDRDGADLTDDLEATSDTTEAIEQEAEFSRHAFGAHFAEVEVDVDSGEVRVRRTLSIFAVGRVLNPHLARSQFISGVTMGIGMALSEESIVDAASGAFANHDLAQYHVPVNADIRELEVDWIDEDDPHLNPMGSKGIGEIGMVGSPAAIGNAVFHATGIRFRELPLRPDRVLEGLVSAGLAGIAQLPS